MLQPFLRSRLVITIVRLALAALIAVPAVASAQTITGQISGRVTDASGGILPGVTVTVVNEGTGFKDTRVTDSAGVYTFTNLRVGTYSVLVELEGFRKEQRTGFSLTADGRISADFALGVGQLNEQVEVTAVLGETVNRTSGEVARTSIRSRSRIWRSTAATISSSRRSSLVRWPPTTIRWRSRRA